MLRSTNKLNLGYGRIELAGAEGFEPPLAVLETAGLPLNLRPYVKAKPDPSVPRYLVSRCARFFRQCEQNFCSSILSVVVFLFLVFE